MPSDFRPPRENRLLIRLAYTALPVLMRARHVTRVKLSEEEWEYLARLRDSRLILSANHPTGTDPLIAMTLARRLGQYFNFVAAREIFAGPYGWLIQRLGVYSIVRGTADRESLQTTRRLLAERDRKVAIFPEGETYYHNDITLPFHCGVTQLGFWTLGDIQKLGKEPRLPILPVAIKYRFLGHPAGEIEARLAGLERAVGLQSPRDGEWYRRLLAIGERVVSGVEREYRLPAGSPEELNQRIVRVKNEILDRVSTGLGVNAPEGPLPEQMRFLFNALRSFTAEFDNATSEYEQRLHFRRVEQAQPLFADLWRLSNCMAMTGHYVRDHPTFERFSDVLSRLEEEVFGRARTWVMREALVRIAEPVELSGFLDQYQKDRRKTVEGATEILEGRVTGLLRDLWKTGHPLPDSELAAIQES